MNRSLYFLAGSVLLTAVAIFSEAIRDKADGKDVWAASTTVGAMILLALYFYHLEH
jgi:hypothetical protein